MRSWITILTAIADMQPGDIDKLTPKEAELVRIIVNAVDKGHTLALSSEDHTTLDSAIDKLLPASH